MKKLIIIILSFTAFVGYGQQYALNTQYMFNEAAFNPAAAGAKDYIPVHFNFRRQWAGFDGAPAAQTLTSHANMGKNLGFGGNLYNESTGPSRSTGLNLMLSYRLRLSKDDMHSLRMGMGVSLSQHLIDVNQLTQEVANDPAIANAINNKLVPDADFGFYYTYGKKGFAGFSVKNATQMRRSLFDFDRTFTNNMARHYYFMGGYNFDIAENWTIKASTMFRMIESRPFQFDVNAIVEWKKMLWLGASYRYKDAVGALVGFQFGIVKAGYSYDYPLSAIRTASSGSHEVFMELQIFSKRNGNSPSTPWLKRNRIYSTPVF